MASGNEWVDIAGILISGAFSILMTLLWFFMRRAISEVEDSIKLLFKKHDDDVSELTNHRLEIAKLYAPKDEIREMLADMQKHFDQRFDNLMKMVSEKDKSERG